MKNPGIVRTIAMLAVTLGLAGCAAGPGTIGQAAEPTITAIMLPTRTPTQVAQFTATDRPPAASPTLALIPTDTPSPEPTATLPPPPTATPTATALPPTPTAAVSATVAPTATAAATATAAPKPASSVRPKATATPVFSGKLVFQTTIGGTLYVINANGSGLRRLTDGVDATWSPDGKQIAFTRWREPRGVWVVNADGSNERRVFDWSSARWPSWSPDGSQILFSRQIGGRLEDGERCFFGFCFDVPAKPHWRLGVVQTGDGSFAEPPSELYSLAPDWSPDGQQVVYSGEHGLVIQTTDGAVSYQITSDGRDTSPIWSPDGKRVAFTRRQHDHWEVYVVDADGRNLTRLTDTPQQADGQPGNSASPAWSPDGRSLAFVTDRSGQWQIWVLSMVGGANAPGRQPKPMFKSALNGLTLDYASVGERAISWTR